MTPAARLIGRWAFPHGGAVRVLRVDGRRVLCGDGRERWWVALKDLEHAIRRGMLRYVGRVR